MVHCNGVGFALRYVFPNGGPILTVRIHELFGASVPPLIAFYTRKFGTAQITEPIHDFDRR